jgi:hypothetical protein
MFENDLPHKGGIDTASLGGVRKSIPCKGCRISLIIEEYRVLFSNFLLVRIYLSHTHYNFAAFKDPV